MAYIGKQPTVGNFQVCDAITVVNGQAAYTMQVSSANVNPENANHMLVSLNGVLQKPGSSFTISGATITFASNLATGDVIDFIILLGNVLDIGAPSDGTVTNAKLAQDIISGETALASEPADTDEFLVSDAGTLKRIDYSLIKGGGAWTALTTTTISGSTSEVIFNNTYFTSSYRDYLIYISDFHCTADANFQMTISDDNGSSYKSASSHKYAMRAFKSDATTNANGSGSASLFLLAGDSIQGNESEEKSSLAISIYDPLSTSSYFSFSVDGFFSSGSALACGAYGGGMYAADVSDAINAIKLNLSTGSFNAGKFTIYGRAV